MSSHRLAFCFPLLLLLFAVAYGTTEPRRATQTFIPIAPRPPTTVTALRKEIHFGSSPIRLRHKVDGRYMIIVTRKQYPAATLGLSKLFHYVLYDSGSRGIRVKTLNSTAPGYDYLYASEPYRGLYFDVDYESGTSFERKQYWYLNRSPPLYDGDVVTFRNNWFDSSYITFYEAGSADGLVNLFCLEGKEDEWILEVV